MTMLNDNCFMRYLHSEVEYLKNCNMSLLIDPCDIINKEQEEVWNDALAYLNSDETGVNRTKNLAATIKKQKFIEVWLCDYWATKKVWALNLPSVTVELDENYENWYQLGKDMM